VSYLRYILGTETVVSTYRYLAGIGCLYLTLVTLLRCLFKLTSGRISVTPRIFCVKAEILSVNTEILCVTAEVVFASWMAMRQICLAGETVRDSDLRVGVVLRMVFIVFLLISVSMCFMQCNWYLSNWENCYRPYLEYRLYTILVVSSIFVVRCIWKIVRACCIWCLDYRSYLLYSVPQLL
jgi:hypothetical protein